MRVRVGYINGFDLDQLAKPRVQENVLRGRKEGKEERREGRRERRKERGREGGRERGWEGGREGGREGGKGRQRGGGEKRGKLGLTLPLSSKARVVAGSFSSEGSMNS